MGKFNGIILLHDGACTGVAHELRINSMLCYEVLTHPAYNLDLAAWDFDVG